MDTYDKLRILPIIKFSLLNSCYWLKLAKIDVKYPALTEQATEFITQEKLSELQPLDVFNKIYQSRYSDDVPPIIMQLFTQVANEVNQTAE